MKKRTLLTMVLLGAVSQAQAFELTPRGQELYDTVAEWLSQAVQSATSAYETVSEIDTAALADKVSQTVSREAEVAANEPVIKTAIETSKAGYKMAADAVEAHGPAVKAAFQAAYAKAADVVAHPEQITNAAQAQYNAASEFAQALPDKTSKLFVIAESIKLTNNESEKYCYVACYVTTPQ